LKAHGYETIYALDAVASISQARQHHPSLIHAQLIEETINHAMRSQLETASLVKVISLLKSIPSLPSSYLPGDDGLAGAARAAPSPTRDARLG